jgi:hypothetical protein
MRYLRSVKGCTKLDQIKNEDIRKEWDIDSTQYKIKNYRKKWIEHLYRMPDERIPKQILKYKPKGRRDQRRPCKRWNEWRRNRLYPNPWSEEEDKSNVDIANRR